MAWIGGAAAAAAAASSCHTGRRKKPNKFLLVLTMLIMVAGIFIPLGFIFLNEFGVNFSFGPMIFLVFFIILGLSVFALLAATAYEEDGEEISEQKYRNPPVNFVYRRKPRSSRNDIWEVCSTDDMYWGASSVKSSKHYCTSCGAQIELDDLFCFSCGRRVN